MEEVAVKSLVEQVVDRMMELVTQRKLEAGDKIPTEKELTELFGVGRSTIREAICQLQNLGVLSVRQGKGTFLKKVSTNTMLKNQDPLYKFVELERDEMQDVMHVRKLLETEIVRLVARKITPKELEELQECYHKHQEVDDARLAHELDQEFHMLLARFSGNSILPLTLNLVNSFLDRYAPIVVRTFEMPEYAAKIVEQHRQILLAIEARDEEKAARAMLRHLKVNEMTNLVSFDIFSEKRRLKLV